MAYDYLGRRVQKRVETWDGSAWTETKDVRFVYDGWNVIREVDEVAGTTKRYAWGLDLSQSMQGAGGIGGLLAVDGGTAARGFAFDANGNVGQLVGQGGDQVDARYEYDGFGNVVEAAGTAADGNPWRFSTKYRDGETGLVYYGFRYYEPELGRWTRRDPIGERGGVNVYSFGPNSPTGGADPTGLVWVPFAEGGGAQVGGPAPVDQGPGILGLFGADERGAEILNHWWEGSGEAIVDSNGRWGRYLIENEELRLRAAVLLWREDTQHRTGSGVVMVAGHAEIASAGVTTGYGLLHGTNANAGDFQIRGMATVIEAGGGTEISYDLEFEWNDITDRNLRYRQDALWATLSDILFLGQPRAYNMHLSWTASSVVEKCGSDAERLHQSEGYPFDLHWRTSDLRPGWY